MYDVWRRSSSSLMFCVFNLGLSISIGRRGQTYLTFYEKSVREGEGTRLKEAFKQVKAGYSWNFIFIQQLLGKFLSPQVSILAENEKIMEGKKDH